MRRQRAPNLWSGVMVEAREGHEAASIADDLVVVVRMGRWHTGRPGVTFGDVTVATRRTTGNQTGETDLERRGLGSKPR